ncbi:MAG: hypothetical protein ABF804_05490 [Liquorilactobacillus ghanensis]|uniref:hypothetical protein n=1 Tax=Liquorilactobacillus ghanensis TaxID=399370 RepID=UPI0039EA0585
MGIFDYFKRKKEEKIEAKRQLKLQQEADLMLPRYIKHVSESLDLIGSTSNPQTFLERRSFLIKEGTEAVKWMKISNKIQDSDAEEVQEIVDEASDHGYENGFMLNVVKKLDKKVTRAKLPKTKLKYYEESLLLINQLKGGFKSENITWLNDRLAPQIENLESEISPKQHLTKNDCKQQNELLRSVGLDDIAKRNEKFQKEEELREKLTPIWLNGENISKKGNPKKSNEVLLPLLKTPFDDDEELYWRLAINYRKLKDYQSEINIIEKALNKEKMNWSFRSKQQFESRLNKAKLLLEKK